MNSTKIKLAIVDIDGILRGKFVSKNKFNKIKENDNKVGFCSVIFGWDCADKCYNNVSLTGWHTGYHDIITKIDLNSCRYIPMDSTSFYFLDYSSKQMCCPRSLLKNVIQQVKSHGFTPMCALEYEWFNFIKSEEWKDIKPASVGNFGYSLIRLHDNKKYVDTILDTMIDMRIPIECIHCESGPGAFEAALEYCGALEMADRSVLFKYGVKNIAKQFGYFATFMAKWRPNVPGAGGHLHQSLWKDGKNIFTMSEGEMSEGEMSEGEMSETMSQYLAGQLYCLPYILPMYAPNINSYKRLVDGYWAPTRVGWGLENRTTTHRVIRGGENSTRIECRVAGADANPYLVIAAALASGLYGIKNKLKLKDATIGNAYADNKLKVLPNNLYEATYKMKKSKIPAELFGKEFVEHFTNTRLCEFNEFNKKVTEWEVQRYFEII